MGIKVGIDLGTTFSAVAILDEKKGQPVIIPNSQGEKITPSVIQFLPDGEIIVGAEAKESYEAGEEGCTSAFKRGMGRTDAYCTFYGKSYTSVELSAILLRHLKQEAEKVMGQKIDEAVVTVPAYFYHKERQATMEAAKKAGLKVRQIINEPTAAAMNYGTNHWRENARVLVYDLGGGTFDVTLVQMKKNGQMESLQTLGDHTLGGKDWDACLASILENKVESDTGVRPADDLAVRQIISQGAEAVKKQLTSKNVATMKVNLPGYGWYTASVTLEDFEEQTTALIRRTGALCENLLKGLNITWQDVTDILLVGGSTRMRQVSAYLKSISGHTPLQQVNPDEAVALGAAIQVNLPLPESTVIDIGTAPAPKKPSLFGKSKPAEPAAKPAGPVGRETALDNALCVSTADVVAHAMGVIAINKEGTHYINKTIIPANQKIPVKGAEAFHFYTSPREDNEVEVYVLQGVKAPLECEIIGKYVVSGIEHDPKQNPTVVRIQYSYDVNGMVHVQARQGDSQRDLPVREEPVPADMSKFGRPVEPEENATAYAPPVDVMMAVDVSGSMSGQPIKDALDAMCRFVDDFEGYPGDMRVGAIAVSDRSEVVQPLTSNTNQCRHKIRSITCCMTGICNEGHPFQDIKRAMGRDNGGRRLAIVLADGVWDHSDVAIRAAKDCHALGIEVVGIGFGSANETFLRKISNGEIGSMMVDQSQLVRTFGKIAQEIGSAGGGSGKRGKSGDNVTAVTWLATDEK